MQVADLFAKLGIPPDYGIDPPRPAYAEAEALEDVEPNILGHMQRLAPSAASAWRAMKAAAAADGVTILLVSGYRGYMDQIDLIRRKLGAGRTMESVLATTAAPGFSQHHSGLAIDVATPGTRPVTEDFEHSEAFSWMRTNADRFDFRMPYGRDNRYGFVYEPWHWSQLPTP